MHRPRRCRRARHADRRERDEALSRAEPEVRIRLPPAASQARTVAGAVLGQGDLESEATKAPRRLGVTDFAALAAKQRLWGYQSRLTGSCADRRPG